MPPTLDPAEDAPGQNQVVVLSDRLWRTRFGGDAGVLSRSIVINGVPRRIIGVMAAGFSGLAVDSAALRDGRLPLWWRAVCAGRDP